MSLEKTPIYNPDQLRPPQKHEISDALVAELKAFGEPDGGKPWHGYDSFEVTADNAKDLIAIVEGDYDHQFNSDDDELLCWVPLHAWRILLTKQYEPAIPALIGRVTQNNDDDWARDDIPRGLEKFGAVAIDFIFKEFREETIFAQEDFGYAALIEVLTGIVKTHPHERDRVAGFLRELLAAFETLPPRLNSFIIFGMIDLVDISAAPHIQKVFERKFLDEEIADWNYVKEKLAAANLPAQIKEDKYKANDFHYSGDAKFQKVLKSLGATTNVDELKCMLVGSFLAVDLIQPSKIASQITEDADEESGGFQTDGQALYFYREFFGLWNELSKYQNEVFPLPDFDLSKTEGMPVEAINSLKIFWTKMHLMSFCQGLAMGNTDEERYPDSSIGEFIGFIEIKITQFDELEDTKRFSTSVVIELLNEVHDYWNQHYLAFAQACKDVRKREIDRQKLVEENRKTVGRNEPCPCGSGQKFKKCCMVVH
ncbi:MAG: hypothetical protein A2Z20_03780 [Bdellovibrionales bacterium RBG_16_40_8]|nr:MAG: hypothetical protein A2Z20_03780 [Bdellovibrionales bacterium RBG_16_40_8]